MFSLEAVTFKKTKRDHSCKVKAIQSKKAIMRLKLWKLERHKATLQTSMESPCLAWISRWYQNMQLRHQLLLTLSSQHRTKTTCLPWLKWHKQLASHKLMRFQRWLSHCVQTSKSTTLHTNSKLSKQRVVKPTCWPSSLIFKSVMSHHIKPSYPTTYLALLIHLWSPLLTKMPCPSPQNVPSVHLKTIFLPKAVREEAVSIA